MSSAYPHQLTPSQSLAITFYVAFMTLNTGSLVKVTPTASQFCRPYSYEASADVLPTALSSVTKKVLMNCFLVGCKNPHFP